MVVDTFEVRPATAAQIAKRPQLLEEAAAHQAGLTRDYGILEAQGALRCALLAFVPEAEDDDHDDHCAIHEEFCECGAGFGEECECDFELACDCDYHKPKAFTDPRDHFFHTLHAELYSAECGLVVAGELVMATDITVVDGQVIKVGPLSIGPNSIFARGTQPSDGIAYTFWCSLTSTPMIIDGMDVEILARPFLTYKRTQSEAAKDFRAIRNTLAEKFAILKPARAEAAERRRKDEEARLAYEARRAARKAEKLRLASASDSVIIYALPHNHGEVRQRIAALGGTIDTSSSQPGFRVVAAEGAHGALDKIRAEFADLIGPEAQQRRIAAWSAVYRESNPSLAA